MAMSENVELREERICKPIKKPSRYGSYAKNIDTLWCSNCDQRISFSDRYCKCCGVKVTQ